MKKIPMFITLLTVGICNPGVAFSQENALTVKPISDKIIIVQTAQGYDNQLAINSAKGIVVFGTHWGPGIAREYHAVIEKEFKHKNFKFVVNPKSRIIS